ncbi:Acyl-CoA synthetase (AMP-forming)/AMP-acid ligase II [Seinonella peptonophila]|uniref:Acyl-CoA synthetase (AMP-forming)/AMP-acid ligase II n=1 Tax=Seinonella peptonophila TaxID=112248 RepID=A0A1M4Z4Q0_9BACL|nr:AMP-binding protein [Seinonella peptonophila]SHF13039.1 Acyl-CoA synthetase (AMP-forming)/AMP-acid ligase II [Seinonella peptonophila]
MNINMGQLLTYRATLYPEHELIVDGLGRYLQKDINRFVNQLANWLQKQNIEPGDRIAVLARNSASVFLIYLSLAKIGSIIVPLSPQLPPRELHDIFLNSKAKILFYENIFSEIARDLIDKQESLKKIIPISNKNNQVTDFITLISQESSEEPEILTGGNEPLFLFYRQNKGVIITHRHLWQAIQSQGHHLDWRSGDRTLVIMPLYHISGVWMSFLNLLKGGTNVYLTEVQSSYIWQMIEDEQITQFMAEPPILKQMIGTPNWVNYTIDHLRYIICGGKPLDSSVVEQYISYGIELYKAYECTEFAGIVSLWTSHMGMSKLTTVGRPLFQVSWQIADLVTGKRLPEETIGEILLQGPQQFYGYWNQPQETEKAFSGGWFHTGDIGKLDQDGFLTIVKSKESPHSF